MVPWRRRSHDSAATRVVPRSVLRRVGLSDEQIRHRVRTERLVRLSPGVYAVGPAPLDDAGRFRAAVLAGGDGALLAGRAACVWWGVIEGSSPEVDVAVPTHRRNRPAVRFRRTRLDPDEATVRAGIPIVCPARAILDLGAVLGGRPLERALNEARVLRLPWSPSLAELVERYPGRRGIGAVREAVTLFEAGPTPTRSEFEERFLELVDRNGLPRPLMNRLVRTSAGTFRVDCIWPEVGVIVELDGWAAHSSRAAMLADRRRDRALQIAGWEPNRVVWDDLDDEARLVADLVALVGGHRAA